MSVKLLPGQVVRRHVETLYDHRRGAGKVRLWDIVAQYGLPLAFGGLVWQQRLEIRGASQLLAGVAILAGFVFGLLIFVFQLRMQAVDDPRIPNEGGVMTLIDELFANVAYTALIGLVTSLTIMIPLAVQHPADAPLPLAWGGAVVFLGAHFVLLLMMCIKRTDIAYQKFRAL